MTISDAESNGGGVQGNLALNQDSRIFGSVPSSNGSSTLHGGQPNDQAYAGASVMSNMPKEADVNLSRDEEASLRLFLSHVNSWRGARGYSSLSESSAIKFLMARKFQVIRTFIIQAMLNVLLAFGTLININLAALKNMYNPILRLTVHYHYTVSMR